MFDHVKRVQGWTTMACHMYDTTFKSVLIIGVCDMQLKDTKSQSCMWYLMIEHMKLHDIEQLYVQGFMPDSTQANWNVVHTVFGSGNEDDMRFPHGANVGTT